MIHDNKKSVCAHYEIQNIASFVYERYTYYDSNILLVV